MKVARLFFIIILGFQHFSLQSQITVDFTADQTEGCGSIQVNFCDNSSSTAGNIVSWAWDLGGVTTSNECQGRIFGSVGSYEICLTVTDDQNNMATLCEPNYIVVHPLPSPDFEATPLEGCIPHTAAFTYTGSPNITEFVWGVDGSTGVLTTTGGASPDAESTYELADQYTISLTVTDDKGCVNFISKEDYITALEPPVMSFHAQEDFKCTPPFSVNFINDNIDPNIDYTWDFGNGITYNGATPPNVFYSNFGTYTVSLIGLNTITDCRDTLILEDYIGIGYPIDFSFTPDQGCEGLSVSFTDESPGGVQNVSWDFGDGTPPSTETDPTHVYENPGFYTVVFTRTRLGCTNTTTATTQIEVFANPDVNYNNDNAFGCSLPHTVNFSGSSTDAISWLWDFGDGNTSTLQNPTHSYTDYGIYNTTLTVVNANGCENVISNNDIQLIETQAMIPDFQFSGCTPLNVSLVDSSISVVPINSWNWEINTPSGLFTSTDENPNFSIVDTGCFDIILTVSNILGCTSTDTFPSAVCVGEIPVVDFMASPITACVEDTVNFTDLSSSFGDFWFWDFGNDKESFDQNPTTFYVDTGTYDVTLLVSNNGCFTQLTLEDYITVTAPKSKFQVIQNCNDPFFITLNNTSIGADTYHWDFGIDGVTTDTSTLFEPSFTYSDTGTYIVTLTTENFSTSCSHVETRKIFIHDPLSNFTISADKGCAPFTIDGINSSIHADKYQWSGTGIDISDDAIPNPEITYDDAGAYTDLQLIVTDVNGCSDTTIYADTIFVNEIDVDFTPHPIGGCQPFEVSFTENATNLFANNIQWDWEFGNNLGDATGQNATFTFEDVGEHKVRLIVTDDWGCEFKRTINAAVEVTSPIPEFTADTFSCVSFPISFSNNSVGNNLDYDWNFGDGNTSSAKNPDHQYLTEGTFTPCLTVTDIYGCTETTCLDDYITISNPVSNFTIDTGFASCPPLIVNFENLSTNAVSYEWDFGDGSGLSNLENPSHVYTVPGVYNVTLIATLNNNCVDTFTAPSLIVLDGPLGDFHYEIDTSCAPMNVTFFAESQGSYTYVWDFGDGSPLQTITNASTDTTVYTYEFGGDFIPKLGIIDQIGCERILESPSSIFVPELSLDFQATDTVLCNDNNPITFLNLVNSTGIIDSLSWQFQGGTPSSSDEFEPTTTFDLPGLYDITLIAHNEYCSDTLVRNDYIRIGDVPDADFDISTIAGCKPLDVSFSDISNVVNGNVNQWHWKFGDGFESFTAQPSHTYMNSGVYEATLIVTTDVGCVDSISQTITVYAEPDVTLSGNQEICIGEITELTATITSDTTGVTYYWENAPTLSCTDCLYPLANPIDTTIYTFVAVSAEGCETFTNIQIDVRPYSVPIITVSNDTTICANDIVQLFVSGGTNVFSYTWDDSQSGLSCYNACLNPIASPQVSTTYAVTVTSTEGCSSSDTVRVNVIDVYQTFAGDDRTICEGDTAQLNLSIGTNPIWLASNGLNCSTCPNPIASPIVTTDFVAQVTTVEGCDIIDTVRVNVLNQQDISAGEDITLCRGESTILDGQFITGAVNPNIIWTPAATLDDASILNPEASPSSTTTYNLTLTFDNCTLRDSVTINVADKTEIEAVGATICLGDTAQLDIIGFADEFEWIPAEGLSDPFIANPVASPTENTTYTVVGKLSTCDPDTSEATIEIDMLPEVSLPAIYTTFPGQATILEIENTSTDYTYEWSPTTDLSCLDCPTPTVNTTVNSEYVVTVTDVFTGCQKVLTTKVEIIDFCDKDLIGMPTAFSPNGDGENDNLVIKYSSALIIDNYSMKIFDRWGGLLYESNNINDTWDGRSNGKLVPTGVVVYFMEFPCHIDGSMVQKSGDITIHR